MNHHILNIENLKKAKCVELEVSGDDNVPEMTSNNSIAFPPARQTRPHLGNLARD